MSAIASIPKSVRGLPSVERVINDVRSLRSRNSELREVAKDAVSPGRATLGIQAGAFSNGVIEAIAGERYAPLAQWAAAAALFGGGLALGQPDMVMAANGMLAPWSAEQGFRLATAGKKGENPFPQAK
jgi:hypothetical protein